MNELKNGGPAFPLANSHVELSGTNWEHANGATLRDYFAAKAMAAISMSQGELHDIPESYDRIASHAYKMADAMLRVRNT